MCGPAGSRLRAGLAWDFDGTPWAALRSIGSSRDSVEGLTGASCGPDLVGPGRQTCYAIGTTASADPRGIFHRPSIGPVPLARSSATRPAGLRNLAGQRLGALEDSEADDRWRTKRSNGHAVLSCKGLCERGLSRVWGFGRLEERFRRSNKAATIFLGMLDVATPAGENQRDDAPWLGVRRTPELWGVAWLCC
jgi:hypothetical protein